MAGQDKRAAIRNYFSPILSEQAKIISVSGVVGLLITLIAQQFLFALILAAGVGLLVLVLYLKGTISEAELDKCIAADLRNAIEASYKKVSIHQDELVGQSRVITGPELDESYGTAFVHRAGKDGRLRYSPISVTILHLAPHQLLSYQCILDITTGNRLREQTDEYFYKDIVSVSTSTQDYQYKTKDGKDQTENNAEMFRLTTSGGTSIKAFLRSPEPTKKWGGDIPIDEAERTVSAIRAMLREKKTA